ncbi:MAG: hypothetical protein ACXADH_05250 [Candidatus Kariarchaeaceae archaeon]|jgi:hypothetical protein
MIDDYPKRLEMIFRKLTDDFKDIWERDYSSKIENYISRLERKGAFDIVYFIYSIPEIEELDSFSNLKNLVSEKLRQGFLRKYERESSDALIDYLVISVTNNEISYDNLFSQEGFDLAFQLLLEDTIVEGKVNHGKALLSGIELENQIIEVSNNYRLRRLTRFEIEYYKSSLRSFFIPQYAAEPFDYHKVNNAYILEHLSNAPYEMDEKEKAFRRDFNERLKEKTSLDIVFEIPKEYADSISTNEVDGLIHIFVSCFRLIWGFDVGIHWIYYNIEGFFTSGSPFSSQKWGHVPPELIASQQIHPKRVSLNSDDLNQIKEFWEVFGLFDQILDGTTLKYFNKALMRFNRSFTERDFEDAILDLAICLEILTSGAKSMTSFLLAPFVSYQDDVEKVEKEISDFDRVRNSIVHGSVSGVEKKDLEQWTAIGRKLASACLRNFIYYVTLLQSHEDPKGKRGIRNTLDACSVSLTRRIWLWRNIPSWSMIKKTEI